MWFPLLVFSRSLMCSASSNLLLILSSVYFQSVIAFFSSDWFFSTVFYFFVEILTEFIHFSPGEHFCDCFFELFIWGNCLSLNHIVIFLRDFLPFLSFGRCSFISSFYLSLWVCFHVLVCQLHLPSLERVVLCRRCLVGLVLSYSLVIRARSPVMGCVCPLVVIGPWLLQVHWWAGLVLSHLAEWSCHKHLPLCRCAVLAPGVARAWLQLLQELWCAGLPPGRLEPLHRSGPWCWPGWPAGWCREGATLAGVD